LHLPSIIELKAYDFYRIAPKGVGMIAVTCMVGGWKEEAYKQALKTVRVVEIELGHGKHKRSVTQGTARAARILRALGIKNLDPDTSVKSGKEAA
jgi:hypothetical protein